MSVAGDAASCRLITAGDPGDRRLLVMRAAVGEPNSGVTGTSCSPVPERELWNRLLVMGDKDNILQQRESRARTEKVESQFYWSFHRASLAA